jgi:hypothetical protein
LWAVRGDEAGVKALSLPGTRPLTQRIALYNPPALGDVDAGALTLLPARSLKVHVLQSGTAVAGADVRVRMGGEMLALWQSVTDANGTATSPPIPSGCASVEAVTGTAEGRARAFLPEEHDIHIQLTPRYDAVVTLVEKESGAPVAGATVQLEENIRAPSLPEESRFGGMSESVAIRPTGAVQTTDAEGIVRFPGLSANADYSLRITAQGFERSRPGTGERLGGNKPSVRITLERVATRTVQWPIEAGEVPAPPNGAQIVLRPAPGSSRDYGNEATDPEREGVVREGRIVAQAIAGYGSYPRHRARWLDRIAVGGRQIGARPERVLSASRARSKSSCVTVPALPSRARTRWRATKATIRWGCQRGPIRRDARSSPACTANSPTSTCSGPLDRPRNARGERGPREG